MQRLMLRFKPRVKRLEQVNKRTKLQKITINVFFHVQAYTLAFDISTFLIEKQFLKN